MENKVFWYTFHGKWVPGSGIAVAPTKKKAYNSVVKKLKEANLSTENFDESDLYEVDTSKRDAFLVDDGDY